MSINKIVCGQSKVGEMIETINGLVDLSGVDSSPYYSQSVTNLTATVNNTSNLTYTMLMMIPVEYNAVRIGWYHAGGGGDLVDLNMVVASTDNIGDLSNTNTDACKKFITPEKNGVEYNEISENGWKPVTWSGAPKLSITDAGVDNYSVAYSDLIEVNSVPHIDGKYPNHRAVLIRVFTGTGVYDRGNIVGFTDPSKFLSECGDAIVLGANRSNGDWVNNLLGWPRDLTAAFSDQSVMPLIVEAMTLTGNKKSIAFIGDSRFASASATVQAENRSYQTLQWKTQQELQSRGVNAGFVSCSRGGRTVNQYFSVADEMLPDSNVSHAVYLCYSANDGAPTVTTVNNAKSKLIRFMGLCKDKGISPILLTSFPSGAGYAAGELSLLNELDDYVSASYATTLSPLKIYGDVNGGWQAGFNEDGVHMTDTGYDDLASKIADLFI